MLEQPPKTLTWVAWAVICMVLIEAARRAGQGGLGYLAVGLAMVAGIAAGVEGIYWILYRAVSRYQKIMEVRSITERVRIYEIWSHMSETHMRFMQAMDPTIITLPGSHGPVNLLLRVSGTEIPFDFIIEFFAQSESTYLVPVGSYVEGSKQRQWAVALTGHFIRQGFAEKANGNHSARWTDRAGAIRWVNLDRMIELTGGEN